MLVRDLEYIEVASTSEVEGGFASAFALAGPSFANGINSALTSDTTYTNTFSGLQAGPIGGLPIGLNTAESYAASESYSS